MPTKRLIREDSLSRFIAESIKTLDLAHLASPKQAE